MEPISFTASLVTLIGVVTASSQKIYALQKRFKNAPKDVESLVEQLQIFKSLLKELEVLQKHPNNAPSQDTLQQVWVDSVALMRQDIGNLNIMVSKVEPLLRTQSSSSKVGSLIRQMLSGKEIAEYCGKIKMHCVLLTNILTIVYSRQINQRTIKHGEEGRAGFQTISSQLSHSTGQLSDETKAGFQMVLSQVANAVSMREAKDLEALGRLDGLIQNENLSVQKLDEVLQQQARVVDMSEAGFQAVHSSLMREGHEVTQAMLSQHNSQQEQIIRFLGMARQDVYSPSKRLQAPQLTTTETSLFWRYYSYRLPIGNMKIELSQARQSIRSKWSASQDQTESNIAVTFVPPWWLSSFAVQYVMNFNHNLIGNQRPWSANLNPLTINRDPFFVRAVEECDVEGVQESFRKGLARSTDYILHRSGNPYSWHLVMSLPQDGPGLSRELSVLEFMIKEGIPELEEVISSISITIRVLSLRMRSDFPELFRGHLKTYAEQNGNIFAGDPSVFDHVFIYGPGSIDWIPDLLFHSSEWSDPWLVDDLSPLAICFIGTLAHADAEFQGRLKKYLASYHSPFLFNSAHATDQLFESTFNTGCILTHFRNLEPYLRYGFLSLLCRTGSPSMLKPFMDIGIDINDDHESRTNMLANAAAADNTDIVSILLDAGANGAFAVKGFLDRNIYLPDARFKKLLRLLVEGARPPVPTRFHQDPLTAILWSSRALSLCPEAPEILFSQKAFRHEALFGGSCWFDYSYMFQAITRGQYRQVELLLQQGAQVDAQIVDLFREAGEFSLCTWLTFSVLCGTASCVSVLIQNGADVTALDGSGRSAVQIAKSNAVASHPRIGEVKSRVPYICRRFTTAEEDAETLAVVERAFNLKFQGTQNFEDYIGPSGQINCSPTTRRERFLSAIQRAYGKVLGFIFTRNVHYGERSLWRLSFFEALLIRIIYILSYFLLFAVEAVAFATGQKPIPRPSRTFLSAVAVLMLTVIWGGSFCLGA